MKKEFSFVLSEYLIGLSDGVGKNVVFHAELDSDDLYVISWEGETTSYSIDEVESAFDEGLWIEVEEIKLGEGVGVR